jgi:hypothetical protein
MNTHADKLAKNKSQSAATAVSKKQKNNTTTFQFVDNRPEAIAQRKLKEKTTNNTRQQPVVQMAGGNNAFLAGKKDYWHVHYDHVKFDTDDGTRVDFAGRNAKKIRKKLKEVKGRAPISPEGRLSYHQCINYIDKHF